MIDEEYIIRLDHIEKRFPGVIALSDVQLHVKTGSVHAIIGENGAGKSTLIKVLTGIYQPEAGEIIYKEEKVTFKTAKASLQAGIALVPQEPAFFPNLSISENIFMGRHIRHNGRVDYAAMHKETEEVFRNIGEEINPRKLAKYMSAAQKQLTLIGRAVHFNADVIIMDEPTSALTDDETRNLFRIIRQLKEANKTVIYISHKLDEIVEIADFVTTLRDGHYVGTYPISEITKDRMIELMLGESLEQLYPKQETEIGKVVLEVKDLTKEGLYYDINFNVRSGEIFSIYGLLGSGRSEVAETIYGLIKPDFGEIFIDGESHKFRNCQQAIKNLIAFVSEDRRERGLFPNQSVSDNFTIASLKKYSKVGIMQRKNIARDYNEYKSVFDIVSSSMKQLIKNLSGGNQQKVIIARCLNCDPRILILDEPTKGIDVAAKAEIHKYISSLAAQGLAVIMISSEIEEVSSMGDRMLILMEGRQMGILEKHEFDDNRILSYAHGLVNEEGAV